ncbi:transcriptional regulator FtsR [Corynebacterium provencense]|uniref:transcriptional regulator FtsR n=1 Tax=Corynebacterium provencense TaxID=1737425 RepID=UPI0008355898|nr:MerR family transcriptional regulator [Corynebacterium provencense]
MGSQSGTARRPDDGGYAPRNPSVADRAPGILPTASIGDVIKQLQVDFPEVRVSKIRFLESEGLISPRRSKSGYRRFSPEDISRIRYILGLQRDEFLPLKVIRERLEAMDAGNVTAIRIHSDSVAGAVTPDQLRAPQISRLTRADVCLRSGADDEFLGALVRMDMVVPDAAGFFSADDVDIVRIASKLREFGIDSRHLRTLVTMARRQADLINRVAEPVAHSRDDNAKERAAEIGREVGALVVSLHATLVKGNLGR